MTQIIINDGDGEYRIEEGISVQEALEALDEVAILRQEATDLRRQVESTAPTLERIGKISTWLKHHPDAHRLDDNIREVLIWYAGGAKSCEYDERSFGIVTPEKRWNYSIDCPWLDDDDEF